MKTILLTIMMILTSIILKAQDQPNAYTTGDEGVSITVTVPVPGEGGTVIAGLYNEETFLKSAPLNGQESDIVDGKATVTFKNVTPGTYAITLFHDKNGNKQMDFEPNGMPKEMYGVSNNVMSMGPPQWNNAKFEVGQESLSLEIVM